MWGNCVNWREVLGGKTRRSHLQLNFLKWFSGWRCSVKSSSVPVPAHEMPVKQSEKMASHSHHSPVFAVHSFTCVYVQKKSDLFSYSI